MRAARQPHPGKKVSYIAMLDGGREGQICESRDGAPTDHAPLRTSAKLQICNEQHATATSARETCQASRRSGSNGDCIGAMSTALEKERAAGPNDFSAYPCSLAKTPGLPRRSLEQEPRVTAHQSATGGAGHTAPPRSLGECARRACTAPGSSGPGARRQFTVRLLREVLPAA
jgi:hypothetical protein